MKRLREIALDTIDQRKNIVGYQISEDNGFMYWQKAVWSIWQQVMVIRQKSWI